MVNRTLFKRDFTLLWVGQVVSQLGDGAGMIGLTWWVLGSTGSATLLGLMAMVRTLVGASFSPFAGVMADRFDKRKILLSMDLARAALYGLLATMASGGKPHLVALLVFVAANGAASQLFNPAVAASVPLLVDKGSLPKANSLTRITVHIVGIISYAAGGLLVSVIGVSALLALDAISFLLAALVEAAVAIPKVQSSNSPAKQTLTGGVREGINHIRGNRILTNIIMVAAVTNFFGAPFMILLPKFVQDTLGAAPTLFGLLLSAYLMGSLIATLLMMATHASRRTIPVIRHAFSLEAALMILFTLLPPNMSQARVALLVPCGFLNGLANLYLFTALQRATAAEHRGKVFGLLNTVTSSLQPFAQGMAGVGGDRLSVAVVFVLCSLGNVLGGEVYAATPGLGSFLVAAQEATDTVPQTAATV